MQNERGMILAFKKTHAKSSWFENLAAQMTRGPYCHCEFTFAKYKRIRDKIVYEFEPLTFAAYCFHPFSCYATDQMHYENKEVWDLFFIPLSEHDVWAAKNKTIAMLGLPYDYWDAFLTPFFPRFMSSKKRRQKQTKGFCSQICMIVLQQTKQFGEFITKRANPTRCSPNKFYKLFKQEMTPLHAF